jgi:hypothetical protein
VSCACSNGLVSELGGLAAQREALAAEVPAELLRYVDEGGNPDVFTAQTFTRANRGNQLAKGKVKALSDLRYDPHASEQHAREKSNVHSWHCNNGCASFLPCLRTTLARHA